MLVSRRSFLILSASTAASAASAQKTPVPRARPTLRDLLELGQRAEIPQCREDLTAKIGYPGFRHCELHAQYQKAFAKWNCHCYTGQCRPTMFRYATVNIYDDNNVVAYIQGYEIYISGEYYRIPISAFRKERADMTEELLKYQAHVCCSERIGSVPPYIECAWLNLVG